MRKTVSLLTAVAMLSMSFPPVSVFAQDRVATASPAVSAAPISPVVLATLKAFPNGGQALTDRIRLLILQNNDLATDVARAIRANGLLTTAQREATEKGLAEALARLGIVAQASGDNRWCRQPDLEKNFYRCPEFWAALAALAAVGGFAAYEASRPSPVVSPN